MNRLSLVTFTHKRLIERLAAPVANPLVIRLSFLSFAASVHGALPSSNLRKRLVAAVTNELRALHKDDAINTIEARRAAAYTVQRIARRVLNENLNPKPCRCR